MEVSVERGIMMRAIGKTGRKPRKGWTCSVFGRSVRVNKSEGREWFGKFSIRRR